MSTLKTISAEKTVPQSLTTGATPAPNLPGCCFNSHIHPLIPMAMKGAVIFFDCSPSGEINMLAENWRNLWGQGNCPHILPKTAFLVEEF